MTGKPRTGDQPAGERPRCLVIGDPIAHSLSPALHRRAYRELGLDWAYERAQVPDGLLDRFMAEQVLDDPSVRGLSVTMPHKSAIVTHGRADELVHRLGVANTWIRGELGPDDPSGTGTARVVNTDVPGLVLALRQRGIDQIERATLVGNGATACSALAALAQLGVRQVQVLARDPARANGVLALANDLGIEARAESLGHAGAESDLLVSSIPASAIDEQLAVRLVAGAGALFDVGYQPWPTPLARAAEQRGLPVVSGLELLAGQATFQVALMTGRSVAYQVLLDEARRAVAQR